MVTNASLGLLLVRTHRGDLYRIKRDDFMGQRIQLPLYLASGRKMSDWHAQMGWRVGRATTLHRENIAEVL